MFGIKRDLFQVKRKTDKTPEEIKLSAHQNKRNKMVCPAEKYITQRIKKTEAKN